MRLPESAEGLVFQRSDLGLSTLMTNVKLFDLLQKYLAVLIYIFSSTGHTVGTYLLNRIPRWMRRQQQDPKTIFQHIILRVEKGENHTLICRSFCAFLSDLKLCVCLENKRTHHTMSTTQWGNSRIAKKTPLS